MAIDAEDIHNVEFSSAPLGRRGYRIDEVNDFLAECESTFRKQGTVTPADVQSVAFSKPPLGKEGYNEEEVDAFLDVLADELARLYEQNLLPLKPHVAGARSQEVRAQTPTPTPEEHRPWWKKLLGN